MPGHGDHAGVVGAAAAEPHDDPRGPGRERRVDELSDPEGRRQPGVPFVGPEQVQPTGLRRLHVCRARTFLVAHQQARGHLATQRVRDRHDDQVATPGIVEDIDETGLALWRHRRG